MKHLNENGVIEGRSHPKKNVDNIFRHWQSALHWQMPPTSNRNPLSLWRRCVSCRLKTNVSYGPLFTPLLIPRFYILRAIHSFSLISLSELMSFTTEVFFHFIGFVKSHRSFLLLRCHNVKNGKEASEVTEGKSSMMRWGRQTELRKLAEEERTA